MVCDFGGPLKICWNCKKCWVSPRYCSCGQSSQLCILTSFQVLHWKLVEIHFSAIFNLYGTVAPIIQSIFKPQIRTCPRATQQGCVKCRWHITIPTVPTQHRKQFRRKGDNKNLHQTYMHPINMILLLNDLSLDIIFSVRHYNMRERKDL